MSRPTSGATLADEWDAIHTILAPLLADAGAAERRATALARHGQARHATGLAEIDHVIEALALRMRTEPKGKTREETRPHARAPTTPPPITDRGSPALPARPEPAERKVERARVEPKVEVPPPPVPELPQTRESPRTPQVAPPLPPPVPVKPTADAPRPEVPPLPPAEPKKRAPTVVKPLIGYDESGATIPPRPATSPETYHLYDDIVMLSGLNDWDGVLISLERLLVLAKMEDHIKEFVDANEVKLLGIYETFLKSFGRIPKRLPAAIDNSMPRPFLRAEKIAAVLGMIDGKTSIQDILRRSALSPLETCSALCQLRRAGVVEVP